MLNSVKNVILDGIRSISDYFPSSQTLEVDIIKPHVDKKEYRLIQLNNGLRALLISDVKNDDPNALFETLLDTDSKGKGRKSDSSDESDTESTSEENNAGSSRIGKEMVACSLCLGVGSYSNPPEIPGLAHLLEHTVFMGSEKYPGDCNFDSFIKRHGGATNGNTDLERSTYYFECSEKGVKEAMDHLAQFFISPLFAKDVLIRERENLQSEFDDSLLSNSARKYQLFHTLAPDGHPGKKFTWGNLKTLRDDVDIDSLYDALHEFRKRHFSAHRMTLVVQGRLRLNTLERYVCDAFSAVPNNNLPPYDFTPHRNTFGNSGDINKLIWMKPLKRRKKIEITWVLPPYGHEYKSRPIDYISWFFDHEGDGSLSAYLNEKLWLSACEGGCDRYSYMFNSIYSVFTIFMKLTEEGFKHLKEVIAAVFSYIAMLRENIPNKAIFDELDYISRSGFRFRKEMIPSDYVNLLSEAMQLFDPKHILAGGDLYFEYKPELITEIINLLTPERANFMISSDTIDDSFYDKIEPWFGTLYKIEEIPKEWMDMWKNCKATEDFHLPAPNQYITTNFDLLQRPQDNPPFPEKIIDDGTLEIWHRQDIKYKRPTAFYQFLFTSTLAQTSPFHKVVLDVLVSFFRKKLSPKIYAAGEAYLYYDVFASEIGLWLSFTGFSEKLPLFYEEVLALMMKTFKEIRKEENKPLLGAIIEHLYESFHNEVEAPDDFLDTMWQCLLYQPNWPTAEYFKELPNINLDVLYDIGIDFLTKTRVSGLMQGNISKSEAFELSNKLKLYFDFVPAEKINPDLAVMKLPPGDMYFKFKSNSPKVSNSAIMNYYQCGPKSDRECCIVDLIMSIMDGSLFNNLRTEQRVGYSVNCDSLQDYGIYGFMVTIQFQSDRFDSENVDSRIDTFLNNFYETLKSIQPHELNEMKKGLCALKYCIELNLYFEVLLNFLEISTREYMFNRYKTEAAIVEDLTIEELCSWYETNILTSKNYKKMSIQVVGSSDPSTSTEKPDDTVITLLPGVGFKKDKYILDYEEFVKRREFYQLPPRP